MTDMEWFELVRSGEDEGWKLVWEKVVEPESLSSRSAGMMNRFSLTAGDLMGMLYEEMIGRGKISLYRGEGSFQGWLKKYVRGFILNADPAKHGEIEVPEDKLSVIEEFNDALKEAVAETDELNDYTEAFSEVCRKRHEGNEPADYHEILDKYWNEGRSIYEAQKNARKKALTMFAEYADDIWW